MSASPRPPCHAQQRAFERYGIVLTMPELRAIERDCATGKSVLMRRDGDGVLMLVPHAGTVMAAVWNPAIQRIVTFLAPDQLRRRKPGKWRG